MRHVTPLLAVGHPSVAPEEAFIRVLTGELALVADDSAAEQVLRNLGLSEDVIEDRIHFSRTGETLIAG